MKQLIFFISKNHYKISNHFNKKKSTWGTVLQFILRSLTFIISGIVLVLLVQFVDVYVSKLFINKELLIPDDTSYTGFLGTIAGICGVFIALYYAAISTISTAVYNKTPNNMRDLFTREKYGNSYIKFLAYVTYISLLFIGMYLLGFSRTYSAVIFMVFISGVSVATFFKLGQRIFLYFDPTTLVDVLFAELTRSIRNVTPKGYRWLDESFQYNECKISKSLLETFETLCDYANNEEHLNGRSFYDIITETCKFLNNYQDYKRKIPTNSYWYPRKYNHKNWYKADYVSIETALKTFTKIQPDKAVDLFWVEDKILPGVYKFIKTNYVMGRYDYVQSILFYVELYLKCLVDDLELSKAYEIIDTIFDILIEELDEISSENVKDILEYEEKIERLAIVEKLQSINISLLLRASEYTKDCSKNNLYRMVNTLKWMPKRGIYSKKPLPHLLEKLEWLRERLIFEKQVEGKILTPNWYIVEILAYQEAGALSNTYKEFFDANAERFDNWIKRIDKKRHVWLSAALLSSELEYWDKYFYHRDTFSKAWESIVEDKKIKGLEWPKMDFDDFNDKAEKRQKALYEKISEKGLFLTLLKRPESFPDYAGQFIHLSAQKIIDSICSGNTESFIKMFKFFHNASLRKYDELRPDISSKDWRLKYDIERAIIPIVNLMDISGYVKVMSEYYDEDKLWAEVKNVWDEYFAMDEGKAEKVNFLFSIREIYNDSMSLDFVRSNWKIQIKHVLQQVKRKMHSQWHSNPIDEIILHQSPIVRIFANDRKYDFYNGIDMFLTEYILNSDLKDLITVPYNEITLKDEIEKEKERWEELKREGEVEK